MVMGARAHAQALRDAKESICKALDLAIMAGSWAIETELMTPDEAADALTERAGDMIDRALGVTVQ